MPARSHVQRTQDDKKNKVRTKKKRQAADSSTETNLTSLLKAPVDKTLRQRMALNLQSALGNKQVQRTMGGGGTGMLQPQTEDNNPTSAGLQADQARLQDLRQLVEEIDRFAFNDYNNLVLTVIHILTALSMIYDQRRLANLTEEWEAWMGLPHELEEQKMNLFTQMCFEIRELVRLYIRAYEDFFRALENGTPGMTRPNRLSDLVAYENRANRIVEAVREARLAITMPGATPETAEQGQQAPAGTGQAEAQQQESATQER